MNRLRKYIKDIVYGANDGVITTFAVIAGVAGASLSNATILIVGISSLLADGFSMASSNYLGTKSECATSEKIGEECEPHRQVKAASATFVAFVIAGFIPLIPYVVPGLGLFKHSIIATLIALALIGAFRSRVTKESLMLAIVETVAIGGVAAVIAYFVGAFIKGLVV